MRCLIVDDSEAFTDVARTILDQDGLEVVGVASTAAEALGLVERLRPDVVLVDVFLGDESGLELAARLAETGDAPVVVLISTHSEADVSALSAGSPAACFGFLPKADLSAEAVRRTVDGRARCC